MPHTIAYHTTLIQTPGGQVEILQDRTQPGTPVVLLTGLGNPAGWWWAPEPRPEHLPLMTQRDGWGERPFLAPLLAEFAPVITYNRAGHGQSRAPQEPRTLDGMTAELLAVLDAAAPGEKLVLAGHSIGGVVALHAARTHPERVAGVILLDSSHPDQTQRLNTLNTPEIQAEQDQIWQEMRERHPERPDLASLIDQGPKALRARSLGEVPLLVLTGGARTFGEKQRRAFPHLGAAGYGRQRELWAGLQQELASASTRSRHVTLPAAGHYVHLDEPQAVAGHIRAFLTGSRP